MSTETAALSDDKVFADARLFSYTGAYAEDGSDEEVSGIAALTFTNGTGNFYQTLTANVSDGENVYEFFITSLKPGARITVLERSKTPFSGKERSVTVTVKESSFFAALPETFAVQLLNGVMNLRNISDRDISGDVYVYYKNINADGYFGGITYRVNFGALAAGELSGCGMFSLHPQNVTKKGFAACWEEVKKEAALIRTPSECVNCGLKNLCPACAAVCYAETGGFAKAPQYACEFSRYSAKYIAEAAERLKDGN